MAAIAGLQDFRQQGPPADIGTFQFPAGAMVFQFTFSGTTYFCAIMAGEQGWVLIGYDADAQTVIQAALDATHEVYVAAGLYILNDEILLNTYNTLRGAGIDVTILRMAEGVYENCITAAIGTTYVFVRYLTVDGLYPTNARQGAPAGEDEMHQNGIVFRESSDGAIEHVKAVNCPWNGIMLGGDSKRNLIYNCEVDTTDWHGIEIWGAIPDATEYPHYNVVFGCHVTTTAVGSYVFENNSHYNLLMGCYATAAAGGESLDLRYQSENRIIGNRFDQRILIVSCPNIGIIADNNIGDDGIESIAISTNSNNGIITGNYISDNISLANDCDNIIIKDNLMAAGATMVVAAGATNIRIEDNDGYNPIGNIADPYTVAAGLLMDAGSVQAFPTTNTNYTVTESPKFITIYGGTVTSISIDGVATGLSTTWATADHASLFLKPGQVLNVVWTVQPSSQVYGV